MLTIRTMAKGDAPEVASVHVRTWREAYAGLLPRPYLDGMNVGRLTRQWIRDIVRFLDANDEGGFVAEIGGRMVGFATAGARVRPAGPGDGEIYMVYVLAEHRRRGVGRALLAAAADHCLRRGLFSLNVWVLQDNSRACRIYEQLGAHLEGQTREMVGRWTVPLLCYSWEETAVVANRTETNVSRKA